MEYLKQFLICYFCPFRNYRVDKRWDKKLNHIIDNWKSFKRISDYTVLINNIEIWVRNWPYAYGNPYRIDVLPKRKTALKLRIFIAEQEGGFFNYDRVKEEKKLKKILEQ